MIQDTFQGAMFQEGWAASFLMHSRAMIEPKSDAGKPVAGDALGHKPASKGAPDGEKTVHRHLVLGICCASVFIVGMDSSILNVGLPSVQRELHASISQAQWTLDAYTLVIACLLMLSASTGDRVGRRRVFQIGLITFSLGSLLCSIAPGIRWLIAFRAVQAIGGSMLNPVAMSIITNTFLDAKERAQAIGIWGGVVGVSIAAGPLLGGALVQSVGWRSIFWINVPIGVATLILAQRFVPESKAPHSRRFDPGGQLLVIGSIGLLIYAIIEAPSRGLRSGEILGCLAGAAVCFAALIAYELRQDEPLIDVRFFRSAPFSGAQAIALLGYTAMGGYLILNTFFLQDVRHFSPFHAGLAILPMPALMALFSPISGQVVGKQGPRLSLVIGGVAITAAGVLAALLRGDEVDVYLYASYALMGFGVGWMNAATTNTAVSGMPREQAGVAAGITSTMRQSGAALGVAIIGSVIAAHVTHITAGRGFTEAFRIGWAIIAVCGLGILILGIATTGEWAKSTAERNVARMKTPLRPLGTSPKGEEI